MEQKAHKCTHLQIWLRKIKTGCVKVFPETFHHGVVGALKDAVKIIASERYQFCFYLAAPIVKLSLC